MCACACVCVYVMTSSVSPTHPAPPGNVVPLLNSVIDVCLVYGVDETSSREIPVTEEGVRREGGERGRGWEGEGVRGGGAGKVRGRG